MAKNKMLRPARACYKHKKIQATLAVCFWLLVWQAASVAVGSALLLVSPIEVARTLGTLLRTAGFWQAVWFSAVRILSGFLLALATGVALAVVGARFGFARVLLQPLMLTIKSVPVASFIILVLLWLSGTGLLAVLISFLMVLPVVYANTLAGIGTVDAALLEMAHVFHVPTGKQLRYIFLPAVLPSLRAACGVGLGLCWKSGVAAEVIGITEGSMGEALYRAKIFFSTGELFAWTLVIVLVSVSFEKLFLWGFDAIAARLVCGGLAATGQGTVQAPCGVPVALVIKNITKQFGAQTVLHHVTKTISYGETVCLMAASGAGKTSLVRILLGLTPPDTGTVTYEIAQKTAQPQSPCQDVRFACVFQEDRLVPQLTALQNVLLACELVGGAMARQTFAALGLVDADLQKPVSQLSGGQCRRVALARALLAQGDILFLDEPFKGLDDAARAVAARCVQAQQQGRTMLIITHDATDATALQARVWTLY